MADISALAPVEPAPRPGRIQNLPRWPFKRLKARITRDRWLRLVALPISRMLGRDIHVARARRLLTPKTPESTSSSARPSRPAGARGEVRRLGDLSRRLARPIPPMLPPRQRGHLN